MSLEVPILSNDFELISTLGREFRNMQTEETNRELIEPIIKSSAPNRFNITTNVRSTPDKNTIFSNNFDNRDDQMFSNKESMDFIIETLDSAKQIRNGQLVSMTDEDNNNLDPRLLLEAKREANLNPDDLFDEFGSKSTDFVNTVKRSNTEYLMERNLFAQPADILSDTFASFALDGSKAGKKDSDLMQAVGLLSDIDKAKQKPESITAQQKIQEQAGQNILDQQKLVKQQNR